MLTGAFTVALVASLSIACLILGLLTIGLFKVMVDLKAQAPPPPAPPAPLAPTQRLWAISAVIAQKAQEGIGEDGQPQLQFSSNVFTGFTSADSDTEAHLRAWEEILERFPLETNFENYHLSMAEIAPEALVELFK